MQKVRGKLCEEVGEGQGFPRPTRQTPSSPVARGTGPRERSRAPETVVRDRLIPNGQDQAILPYRVMSTRVPDSTARDRPSPYDTKKVSYTVARGPVPRDPTTRAKNERQPTPFPVRIEAWRGTGPRPTVKGDGPANRSAGACPPRAFTAPRDWRGTGPRPTSDERKTGEGQALALR